MSSDTYRILHFVGLAMLFASLGASTLQPAGQKAPKFAMILHGIGLLVMLVAGFGMLAKLGYKAYESWVLVKVFGWLILGALPVLVRRRVVPGWIGLLLAIAIAGGAAYVARFKL